MFHDLDKCVPNKKQKINKAYKNKFETGHYKILRHVNVSASCRLSKTQRNNKN